MPIISKTIRIMKKVLLLILAVLMIVGCSKNDDEPTKEENAQKVVNALQGTWRRMYFWGEKAGDWLPVDFTKNYDIRWTFSGNTFTYKSISFTGSETESKGTFTISALSGNSICGVHIKFQSESDYFDAVESGQIQFSDNMREFTKDGDKFVKQ